jgi:hypothetical protein
VPHAWVGNQIEENQYLIVLTDEERGEAERAAKKFIGKLLSSTVFQYDSN